MGVMPGYKQTEVGVIPQDWETDTMLRISRQIMDYRGRTPKKLGMEWGGGDIPALSAGNVKKGFVDFGEECYFGSDELYRQWMTKGDVAKDDILFTTEAPLGNVALVPDDRRYILSQRTILLQVDPQLASSTFLFQMLLSDRFQRTLADYSSGSTAKGIQRKKFERLSVALPPLAEQRAIAAALSDVDALLGGLDRLIAKKRDLKQAAMQQLLTGQTRLPGFSGAWEVKRIAEIGIPSSERNTEGAKLPVLTCSKHFGFMDSLGFFKNQVFSKDLSTYRVIRRGEIGYPANHVEEGSIGLQDLYDIALVSPIYVVFRVAEEVSSFFLHRLLKLDSYRHRFKTATTSSVDRRGSLRWRAFSEITVELPPTKDEQTAIATVLSDMDAELAALEARRDKTRDLKQAMMQELLTGRTRLV
jgi:type I restriction enzyme S subunit